MTPFEDRLEFITIGLRSCNSGSVKKRKAVGWLKIPSIFVLVSIFGQETLVSVLQASHYPL